MFCAICIDGTGDLRRNDEGYLECARCRDEHPIYGGYSFAGGAVLEGGIAGRGHDGSRRQTGHPRGSK
jgi:hypothetical protein